MSQENCCVLNEIYKCHVCLTKTGNENILNKNKHSPFRFEPTSVKGCNCSSRVSRNTTSFLLFSTINAKFICFFSFTLYFAFSRQKKLSVKTLRSPLSTEFFKALRVECTNLMPRFASPPGREIEILNI